MVSAELLSNISNAKSALKINRLATFAWVVLAYNLAVILWGAYVRATGSGAGCGSHWPLCNGEVMPRAPQIKTVVELTHRLTSGVALLLVIGLAVWAFRAYPRKHLVRLGAGATVFFILTEALIGAGLVLFELVADNASMARALFLSVHLVNTFLLLAALALTAWWASTNQEVRPRFEGTMALLLGIGFVATLVLGVSGAVTALGDTLFPVSSLAEGLRQDFSPTAHLLVRLRVLHPVIAIAVGSYLIFAASIAVKRYPDARTKWLAGAVSALIFIQLGAGALNVALLAPTWLQLLHLLLADLLWIAFMLLAAVVCTAQQQALRGSRDVRINALRNV